MKTIAPIVSNKELKYTMFKHPIQSSNILHAYPELLIMHLYGLWFCRSPGIRIPQPITQMAWD